MKFVFSIFILAKSSDKCNVTVWRPSLCSFVRPSVPSFFLTSIGHVVHMGGSMQCGQCTFLSMYYKDGRITRMEILQGWTYYKDGNACCVMQFADRLEHADHHICCESTSWSCISSGNIQHRAVTYICLSNDLFIADHLRLCLPEECFLLCLQPPLLCLFCV